MSTGTLLLSERPTRVSFRRDGGGGAFDPPSHNLTPLGNVVNVQRV